VHDTSGTHAEPAESGGRAGSAFRFGERAPADIAQVHAW